MHRQMIQSFLNLPGILGLVLMDGRSRPYFCGIEDGLNYQQREALTQGIQQVVNTTPADFDSFAFRFSQNDAYIYKLVGNAILLVLTAPNIKTDKYREHVAALRDAFQDDPHNIVSNFRMMAGGATLGGQQYWPTNGTATAEAIAAPPPLSSSPTPPPAPAPTPAPAAITWGEILPTLNALSDGTGHYLGKIVVANTWKSTRSAAPQLEALQVDRSGHFTLAEATEIVPASPLSPQDQTALQAWVNAFIDRCSRIIRDYRATVLTTALTDEQRQMLKIQAG
jgi:hypothetical protein